ncbi:MAG TPA: lipid-binding SYLF domain-containing protein [Bryobacteraceae bacterium]|nr:lipid-binding SYLF domain-containing protein [Bryobacteraceae bacterium]
MNIKWNCSALAAVLALSAGIAASAATRSEAQERLDAATATLGELMRAGDNDIPQELIDNAKCIVVIPGMKKAGFILAGKYGRGFAACRRSSNMGWSAPAAMRVEGGSFGFQIGVSDTDIVLLVMNSGGMRHLLSNKFTLGGEATVAAGPIGRDAAAQTDAMLSTEMLSYSRSHGLFAGISLEGATLRPDGDTNRALYGRGISSRQVLTGSVKAPAYAAKFEHALTRHSPRRQ